MRTLKDAVALSISRMIMSSNPDEEATAQDLQVNNRQGWIAHQDKWCPVLHILLYSCRPNADCNMRGTDQCTECSESRGIRCPPSLQRKQPPTRSGHPLCRSMCTGEQTDCYPPRQTASCQYLVLLYRSTILQFQILHV